MRKLRPGFYTDDQGDLHLDIPEILNALGVEDTPENRQEAAKMFAEELHRQLPHAEVHEVD